MVKSHYKSNKFNVPIYFNIRNILIPSELAYHYQIKEMEISVENIRDKKYPEEHQRAFPTKSTRKKFVVQHLEKKTIYLTRNLF